MVVTSYVGTYADKIYTLEIDAENKKFGEARVLAELAAPSYLTVADGKYLLVCSEVEQFDSGCGRGCGGGLVSYEILHGGGLRELSRINAGGTVTCHVAYDPASRRVAAANYGDGSFAVCALDENGRLSQPQIFVKHSGGGPDRSRQAGPHAHQCVFAPDGTLWVCDLGLDAVIQYALDGGSVRELSRLRTPAGSGARHIVFDKTGGFAYVICEMASIVATFKLDGGDILPCYISPLTNGEAGQTGAAAIKYRARDGLLLATNRFIDNISLYSTEHAEPELCDRIACGKIPRDAAFVPGADLIVAGFQEESRAALYDISNGRLELADETAIARPVCFTFNL